MLDIIDKYIAKLFMGYFLGTLLVLVTLFVAIDSLSAFASVKTTLPKMFSYIGYSLPDVIYQMLPAVCMIATLFTLGGMNKSSELVALFSLGNSLARVSAPVLVIVAFISVIAFWMSDRIIPAANKKKNYVWYIEIRNKPNMYFAIKNSRIWYRQKNVLYNIKSLAPEVNHAYGLSFYYFNDNWDLVQMITAKEAKISENSWELLKGSLTLFTDDTAFPMTQIFESKKVEIDGDIAEVQEETKRFSEMLSIKDLRQFIRKNAEAGLDTLSFEVDLHSKFGYAIASFIMAFIAIPFSVTNNRSGGRVVGITICIGLAFVYWSLLNIGITMGKNGYLTPLFSAWLPNIFMVGLTTFFILRLKK